jgi:hypothetical protein
MPSWVQILIACTQEFITCLQNCLNHLNEYAVTVTPDSSVLDTDIESQSLTTRGRRATTWQVEDPLRRCINCSRRRVYQDRCEFHLTAPLAQEYYGSTRH